MFVLNVLHRLSDLCVGRAFTSVYGSLQAYTCCLSCKAVCVMGCDRDLAGAGEAGRISACVVRELCKLWHGWMCLDDLRLILACFGVFGRVGEGWGVCFGFFAAIVFFALLHQFLRFRRPFPVLATSPQLSQTPDSIRSPGGRVSRPDVQGRVIRGQSRQHFFVRTFALGFAHVSSPSLPGTGQFPILEGLSLAFRRFPASGSRGLITGRSQYCPIAFGSGVLYH